MTVKREEKSSKVTLREFINEILDEPASRWYWWTLAFMVFVGLMT